MYYIGTLSRLLTGPVVYGVPQPLRCSNSAADPGKLLLPKARPAPKLRDIHDAQAGSQCTIL